MLSDELHTVIDEDESDFAELCFLFRVQKRVVQGVAQLLQDRQENSAYLECEEETKDPKSQCVAEKQQRQQQHQPVVQGQVTMGVAEDQPASKSCVCSSQLPLHRVLAGKHLLTLKYLVVALRDFTWARMRTDSLLKSPFHVKGIALVLCSSYANRIFSRCLLKIKVFFLLQSDTHLCS